MFYLDQRIILFVAHTYSDETKNEMPIKCHAQRVFVLIYIYCALQVNVNND